MTTARKKVVVRRFTSGLLRGYISSTGFVRQESGVALLEILDLAGRVQAITLTEVKALYFVREFNVDDEVNPERLPRRTFLGRPRGEGLWIRLLLHDEEQIEGLAPLDLALADGLAKDLGIQFIPPDIRGNTLRMYVPRSAMSALQVVAVVTTPSRRKMLERGSVAEDTAQLALALPQAAAAP